MAMTGADKLFIDTNVLIHATIQVSSLHQIARQKLEENYQAGTEIWISRQILREFAAALTRPQPISPALPISTVITEARFYEARFEVANEDDEVTNKLFELLLRIPSGGKHIHDANIVATMQANGITQLLTENVSDFARYSQLITIIPLV
jgi:predicted nucleic acid-binding protein